MLLAYTDVMTMQYVKTLEEVTSATVAPVTKETVLLAHVSNNYFSSFYKSEKTNVHESLYEKKEADTFYFRPKRPQSYKHGYYNRVSIPRDFDV